MTHAVIGISGKKQSGKDLAFQIMNSVLTAPKVAVRRYAFADAVKRLASTYFGYPTNEAEKERFRFVLQGIGQMMRDEVSENYWIEQVMQKIAEANVDFTARGISHIAIITDLRYQNEYDAVSAIGTVLRIERPSLPRTDTHPSETELDDYTFQHIILNNGDKKEYIEKVKEWTKAWKKSVNL